jgi:hypothetical protein
VLIPDKGDFESDVDRCQDGREVMRIRRQNFVIGRKQDRAHQEKRDGQLRHKRDDVAVNAGEGGGVTDRFVCRCAFQHKRGERDPKTAPINCAVQLRYGSLAGLLANRAVRVWLRGFPGPRTRGRR